MTRLAWFLADLALIGVPLYVAFTVNTVAGVIYGIGLAINSFMQYKTRKQTEQMAAELFRQYEQEAYLDSYHGGSA